MPKIIRTIFFVLISITQSIYAIAAIPKESDALPLNVEELLNTADTSCFYTDPFAHFASIEEACLVDALFFTDPNAWNHSGERLLHLAATENRPELIQVIVEMGANIYALNNSGKTPRQQALQTGNEEAFRELERIERETEHLFQAIRTFETNYIVGAIDRGAAIGARDFWYFTPLLLAAEVGNIQAVEILLNAGSSLRERNYKGDTVLHVAVRAEQLEMVSYLLKVLPHPNVQNQARETALNIAWQTGNDKLISDLRSQGAKFGQVSRNRLAASMSDGEGIYPVPE